MGRKKPFSGKQKKAQLQEKKEKQRANQKAYGQKEKEKAAALAQDVQPATTTATLSRPTVVSNVIGEGAKSSQKSLANAERYKLKFKVQSKMDIEDGKKAACSTLPQRSKNALVLGFDELYYRTEDAIGFPLRPKWDYNTTKEELDEREEAAFEKWMNSTYSKHGQNVSHFEHNLETWRQLWRVLEVSDIILIVVDIRHPALHFPPELYSHVNVELGKPVVLVMNKVDMAGDATQEAWIKYMKDLFPNLHIVRLSSFPDEKQILDEEVYMKPNIRLNDIRKSEALKQKIRASKRLVMQACADACETIPRHRDIIQEYVHTLEEGESQNFENDNARVNDNGDENESDSVSEGASASQSEDETASGVEGVNMDCEGDENQDVEWEHTDTKEKPFITIGVIGQPNVGKSTLINTLFGRKVVSTSKTPGRTKHFQTMFIAKNMRLCDCPGIIFPSYAKKELQIISGLYPISQVREPYTSVAYLASKIPLVNLLDLDLSTIHDQEYNAKAQMTSNYRSEKPNSQSEQLAYVHASESDMTPHINTTEQIPSTVTAYDLCDAYARKRGFYTAKAGRPDSYRAANQLLRMAVEGRLIVSFKPPKYYRRPEIKETSVEISSRIEDNPIVTSATSNMSLPQHSDENINYVLESKTKDDWIPSTNAFSLLMEDESMNS